MFGALHVWFLKMFGALRVWHLKMFGTLRVSLLKNMWCVAYLIFENVCGALRVWFLKHGWCVACMIRNWLLKTCGVLRVWFLKNSWCVACLIFEKYVVRCASEPRYLHKTYVLWTQSFQLQLQLELLLGAKDLIIFQEECRSLQKHGNLTVGRVAAGPWLEPT